MNLVRTDEGFRLWFSVEDSFGEPRTGLNATDISITLIAADDSVSTTGSSVESTQLPGVYYVDFPPSFFQTHGSGNYVSSVTINTTVVGGSGEPHVVGRVSRNTRVYQEDLDSLGQTLSAISEDNVVQSWVLSKNPTTLIATVIAENNGAPIVFPGTATLDVVVRKSDGSLFFQQTGVSPNGQGYFEVSQVITPTVGTLLASFVTITDGMDIYRSVAPLSIPDLS